MITHCRLHARYTKSIATFNRYRRDTADLAIRDQLRQAADELADALRSALAAEPADVERCLRDAEQAGANLRALEAGLRAMVLRDVRSPRSSSSLNWPLDR